MFVLPKTITMSYVDRLSGREFELFTGKLLKRLGYHHIVVTPASGDHGIDVIAESKLGKKIGIQCKHLGKNESVGFHAIEETFFGRSYYNLDTGIILTNRRISNNTIKSSRKSNIQIKCWNRNMLKELIDIANNIGSCTHTSNMNTSSELSNNVPKSISDLFSRTYSLKDVTLYGILATKFCKRHNYHIRMSTKYLEDCLGFNDKDISVNNDDLMCLCGKDSMFGYYSTKYEYGYMSLFECELNKDRTYIRFDLSSNFIKLLDGTAIKDY